MTTTYYDYYYYYYDDDDEGGHGFCREGQVIIGGWMWMVDGDSTGL